jgi:hypothetical protein
MPANLARQNVAMTAAQREFWRSGTCTVWVGYGLTGALVFDGYDRAHLDGYEYHVSVEPTDFPVLRSVLGAAGDADVVDAVCAAAEEIMAVGERRWLQTAGIPCELQVW